MCPAILYIRAGGTGGTPLKPQASYWVMNDDAPSTCITVPSTPQPDTPASSGGIRHAPAAAATSASNGGAAADTGPHRKSLPDTSEVREQRLKSGGILAPTAGSGVSGDGGGSAGASGGVTMVGVGEGASGGGVGGADGVGGRIGGATPRWGKVLGRRPLVERSEMSDLEAQLRSPAKVCDGVCVCWSARFGGLGGGWLKV